MPSSETGEIGSLRSTSATPSASVCHCPSSRPRGQPTAVSAVGHSDPGFIQGTKRRVLAYLAMPRRWVAPAPGKRIERAQDQASVPGPRQSSPDRANRPRTAFLRVSPNPDDDASPGVS